MAFLGYLGWSHLIYIPNKYYENNIEKKARFSVSKTMACHKGNGQLITRNSTTRHAFDLQGNECPSEK